MVVAERPSGHEQAAVRQQQLLGDVLGDVNVVGLLTERGGVVVAADVDHHVGW
jgi:hypothetical protein